MQNQSNVFVRALVLVSFFTAFLAISVQPATAGTTDLNIAPYYNHTWGSALFGGPIASAPITGSTGTGITFANYNGNFVIVGPDGSHASPFNMAFTPVPLTDSSQVNALFNTTYGVSGTVNATVTFTNSAAQQATFSLVGGQTIRDYNQSTYVNTLTGSNTNPLFTGVTTQNWWNNGATGQRLDMQTFVLPASWTGTNLTGVTIADPYTTGQTADPALSAMQVTTSVPEPASLALLAVAGLSLLARRR